jgi:hypothetical protein
LEETSQLIAVLNATSYTLGWIREI